MGNLPLLNYRKLNTEGTVKISTCKDNIGEQTSKVGILLYFTVFQPHKPFLRSSISCIAHSQLAITGEKQLQSDQYPNSIAIEASLTTSTITRSGNIFLYHPMFLAYLMMQFKLLLSNGFQKTKSLTI